MLHEKRTREPLPQRSSPRVFPFIELEKDKSGFPYNHFACFHFEIVDNDVAIAHTAEINLEGSTLQAVVADARIRHTRCWIDLRVSIKSGGYAGSCSLILEIRIGSDGDEALLSKTWVICLFPKDFFDSRIDYTIGSAGSFKGLLVHGFFFFLASSSSSSGRNKSSTVSM